ncbi:hypothetical protein NL676_037507 [Syzygium grande]|nr:hypothetical protein NL676_037507 [Syzygium grande]
MMKWVATRRNPEGPKACQVRVPKRKAAPMSDTERLTTKIRRLLKMADFHEGGIDWIRVGASKRAPCADFAFGVTIWEGRGLRWRFKMNGGF